MISAIAVDGIRAFVNLQGATTCEVFRAFVEQQLVPNLREGDCVLMDNLSSHHDPQATAAIKKAGASVLFLPPYSPEWNPIEKMWSKGKTALRRLATDSRQLFDRACVDAFGGVSTEDIKGWYRHGGYPYRNSNSDGSHPVMNWSNHSQIWRHPPTQPEHRKLNSFGSHRVRIGLIGIGHDDS
jgi:transposase